MKEVKFFPFTEKIKRKFTLFSVNTKNISSHVLKIAAISLVLRTHEITDIFNTFDEIPYVWYSPQKRKFPLYVALKFYVKVFLNIHISAATCKNSSILKKKKPIIS